MLQDIIQILNQYRPVPDQKVGSAPQRIGRAARNRQNIAAFFQGDAGGYESAALEPGLHHDDRLGQTHDDPVPFWEMRRGGSGPGGKFRQNRATGFYPGGERLVLAWIDDVDSRPKDGDGPALSVQRPFVRGSINPPGEARNHLDAVGGQPPRQVTRERAPSAGGPPRSHDGDPPGPLGERSAAEENGWRIVDLGKGSRV